MHWDRAKGPSAILKPMTANKTRDVEASRRKIEAAAMKIFTRQGYHGTSIREIAEASGFSIGNLYNHYPTKEDLFVTLVKKYEQRFSELRGKALADIDDAFHPEQLERLAASIKEIVCKNPDYWRLMYIDVVEFGNKHFAHTFRGWAEQVERLLGERLQKAAERGSWGGVKPSLAFTMIYLQFFTYYLVETLFRGKQHLGVPETDAIRQMIRIFTEGFWAGNRQEGEAP
jgi:AcrR family transcriptional regulator